MADEERKKSFWETLPGIIIALAALLTGVAAVIAAVAAMIAALNGGEKERTPQPSPPAADVEEAARAKAREAEWKQKLAETEQRAEEAERRVAAVEAVRKARKGTTIGQYVDHGDGTITDTKTGLMWKRCLEGLAGVNCEDGNVKAYTWNDAALRFNNVEYAGYSDWRLPTIDELKTLVYCSNGLNKKTNLCNDGSERPTINQQAFPNTEAMDVWSGSPYAGFSDYVWYVSFSNGYSYSVFRANGNAVRLVCCGQ